MVLCGFDDDAPAQGLTADELPSFIFESAPLPSSSTNCTPSKSKAPYRHSPVTVSTSEEEEPLNDTLDGIITPQDAPEQDDDEPVVGEVDRVGECDVSTVSMSGAGCERGGGLDSSSVMMDSPVMHSQPEDEDSDRSEGGERRMMKGAGVGGSGSSGVQQHNGSSNGGSNKGRGGNAWKKISFGGIVQQEKEGESVCPAASTCGQGERVGGAYPAAGHGGEEVKDTRQSVSSPLKRSRPN